MAGKRILLVDDDPAIIESMRLALADKGYDVHTAHDGEAGWEQIQQGEPDLVVLDIMMPRSSGFVVLEKLSHEQVEGLKVIIVTAAASEKSKAYAQFQGAAAYLPKPFTMDQLLTLIERELTA